MFLAFVVVGGLYVAVVFVIVGTLPAGQVASEGFVNLTPVSSSANAFMGQAGMILMSAAAILTFVTTANGGLMAASRAPMAMSRDGLLPGLFARVSGRFGTPYMSVIITGVFMVVVILFLSIEELVKVAGTMILILFVLVNVAVLIMRGSRIPNYRPRYRSPLFPWVQLGGIAIYMVLIIDLCAALGLLPLITTGSFLLIGVIWYLVYLRPRTMRESALVYMVRNVVASEIQRTSLEEDLRALMAIAQIVQEEKFRDRWLAATSPEQLRDLVLLSRRPRDGDE